MPRQIFSFRRRNFAVLAALAVACAGPNIAAAALGEPEASIQGDVSMLQGTVNSTEHLTYRMHEIALPSGTLVREFVTQSGGVFAVSWRGPRMPNLRQTLGKYFDSYVAAAKAVPVNRHRVDVTQPGLVVHAMGHMGAFTGIAYVPESIPAGVSLGELQ